MAANVDVLTVSLRDGRPSVGAIGAKGRMRGAGLRCFAADHPGLYRNELTYEGKGRRDRLW